MSIPIRPALRSPLSLLAQGAATLAAVALLGGCAGTGKRVEIPRGATVENVQMEPLEIRATGKPGDRTLEAYDAGDLFEQAGADLATGHFDTAAEKYDRLLGEFPDSRYAVAALYNAGLALEGKQDWAGAIARYRQLVDRHPDAKDVHDALFRLGSCLAEQGNWPASSEAFSRLLERSDLGAADRIEALARRGLAQYNLKDPSAAERTFRQALAVFQENQSIERLDDDFYVALTHYYLAEIAHDAFRALPLRLPDRVLRDDLEAKAKQLLVAQGRYVDVARLKNPSWATAAGYQMARLYKELYDAMLAAPVPPALSTEAREVYLEELKKEIEPLLRKAIHAHELTLQVAERNGVDNEWVRKSTAELADLRVLLLPEGEATPVPGAAPQAPAPTHPALDKMEPPPLPRELDQSGPRMVL